jgi:putative membrane protein
LSRHLSKESTEFALDESYNELYDAEKAQHPPVSLVNMMMNRILHLHRENKISGEQMIFLDKQLSGFLEVCGGCERIKNTPIPFSYSSFVKKFILTYVLIYHFLRLQRLVMLRFRLLFCVLCFDEFRINCRRNRRSFQ